MSTREQLNQYLVGLEKRIRLLVVSKGVAIALGVALGATLALVLITNAFAFSDTSVAAARVVLFVSLAVALGTALIVPLVKLNQRGAAGKAESACPEFEERLLTYVERRERRDPMLELLAADTMRLAPQASAVRVVPKKSIFTFATSAGAAGAVLLWMILAGPGYLGFGAHLLWAGPPTAGASGYGGYYQINVEPGNKLVKRRSDIAVTATLQGFQAPLVRLMAKYQSAAKWEEAAMVPRANGTAYEYLLAALPEPVEYYVEAAGVKSKTFRLDVIDLPNIKKIKVTYHYPAWLGQADSVEDPGGDLRAVAGTVAELSIETDKPLSNGMIEMEDGVKIELQSAGGNRLTAKIPVQKDGVFHYAAKENGESVRLSEDYFIEAKQDQGPSVKITHPGSDTRVSPIEEVSVEVTADDDFALHALELHFSVNGGKEIVKPLLAAKGVKAADGKYTLALEEFNMIVGDVVAMYATAKDARVETKSDIVFIEAQAFEKNYSQSQAGGGGGGGGGGDQQEQNEISKRQKEIITATFNAIRGGAKDRSASPENAEFLSEVQAKLKAQSESLAQRVTSRQLAGANQEFQAFTKEMQAAAAEMGPAATGLKGLKWQDAYEFENKALTHLRRAEETMRDIQVAFGQQGGGGGGGGGAGRDLANLFDLELDTEKNQYEQGQSASSSAEQQQKEVDEALDKLQQLARRQQELANQNKNGKQQSIDQRWQQEMLRREAEELKKQMEQLSQQQNGQQSKGQQGSQSSSSSSQGQSGQSGQSGKDGKQDASNRQQPRGASEERLKSALDQIRKATDDMRQAQQNNQNGGQDSADARRAAERLKDAADQVAGMRRQDATSQLGGLGDRAKQLSNDQHNFEERLKKAYPQGQDARAPQGTQPGATPEQARQLAGDEEKLLEQLKKLEEDMQKSARQMSTQQPNASSRLREGVSATQQNDIKRRMEYSSEYIRRGMGGQIIQWQPPVTRGIDELRDKVAQAQEAMGQGNQQQQGANDAERQLARLEQMRANLERAAGRGQQGGKQGDGKQGNQAGGKQGDGKQGDGNGGQQAGGKQGDGKQGGGQAGGGNQGGNQVGGGGQIGQAGGIYNGGGAYNGGQFGVRDGYNGGRYPPEGQYDPQNARPVDPSQAVRDAARQLAEMRTMFKDDPDVTSQIQDLEQEIRRLNLGSTASAELQERLNRTVLPQLETLEVQLRRQMTEQQTGQVRSGGTDKVPAGFSEQVAEYWRKLNKGK